MSKSIVVGLFTTALLVPAVARAAPERDPTAAESPQGRVETQPTPHQLPSPSLGAGYSTYSPSHVAEPEKTQIDPSIPGPENEVAPGAPGSGDPPQAAHPKPVR